MRKSIDRVLKLSTAALIMSSFLALASAPMLGLEILLLGLLLLALQPLGESLDRMFGWYRYCTTAVTALLTVTLPLWILSLGLLPAVIALIVYIMAHKLAHQKERKDYFHLFLMCFLLLVAACGLGPEAVIGLAMLCFLLSAVWALLSLQIRTEAAEVGPGGLADIIGLSDREPAPTSPSASLLDWGIVRSVGAVCFATALLTAALFFGMPRVEAGLFGRTNILGPGAAQRTGLGDSVEVGRGGLIEIDRSPVMRVEFPDIPDGQYSGELYWPSSTMDTFTAGVWERLGGPYAIRDERRRPNLLPANESNVVAREPSGRGQQVRQIIYLDDVPQGGLPCLASPLRVRCEGATVSWNREEDGYFVQVDRLRSSSISYEVVSEVEMPAASRLREARQDYRQSMSGQDYFLLTRHSLQERTVRLAQQLTERYDNLYDKARALEVWLGSDRFVYTLDTPELPRHSPVDAFVFEERRGHCQLYASALALMLRSIGVPTRVVSGYRGGEWSQADKAYIISRDMAHLWVEAYFLDHGWVTFDPSPQGTEDAMTPLGRAQMAIARLQLRLRMFWYQRIIGYEGGWFTLTWLKDFGAGIFSWTLSPYSGWLDDNSAPRNGAGIISFLALPGLLLVLVGTALYLWFRRRAQQGTLTDGQRRAALLFSGMRRVLRRRGIDCERKTAGELVSAARGASLPESPVVADALKIYNEARFGNRPLGKAQAKLLLKSIRMAQRTVPSR